MFIFLMIYRFEEYRNTLVTYYQQNNVSEPVLQCSQSIVQIMFIDDITLDENTYNNVFAKFYNFDKVYGRELN